jgi:hypothetical protein
MLHIYGSEETHAFLWTLHILIYPLHPEQLENQKG